MREERERVDWVVDWIDRMTRRYGGIVYEKNGKCWDWGQALCRECYGEDWNSLVPDVPSLTDIDRARKWEEGESPEWWLIPTSL